MIVSVQFCRHFSIRLRHKIFVYESSQLPSVPWHHLLTYHVGWSVNPVISVTRQVPKYVDIDVFVPR